MFTNRFTKSIAGTALAAGTLGIAAIVGAGAAAAAPGTLSIDGTYRLNITGVKGTGCSANAAELSVTHQGNTLNLASPDGTMNATGTLSADGSFTGTADLPFADTAVAFSLSGTFADNQGVAVIRNGTISYGPPISCSASFDGQKK
jgi:hypothetical protein